MASQNPVVAAVVTDGNFKQEVLACETPVLVLMCEKDILGQSMMLAMNEIAAEFVGRARVCVLDAGENPRTPEEYGVQHVLPAVFLLKDGDTGGRRWLGPITKSSLVAALDEIPAA